MTWSLLDVAEFAFYGFLFLALSLACAICIVRTWRA